MKKLLFVLLNASISLACISQNTKIGHFNTEKDLLLLQCDCKTDVDDLHTVAAMATLMANDEFKDVNYHAIAGTYGVQKGLYVPANELFQLAFKEQWTDAHNNFEGAIKTVGAMVLKCLKKGGDIWIAEAGQSDFTYELVKLVETKIDDLETKSRFHVVQHSDWNESVTDSLKLQYVTKHTDYHKIKDGNAVGNGTPGFRTPGYTQWKEQLNDEHLVSVWQLAVDLGLKYNGKEDRYNNKAIEAEGLDFSDLSEVCYILGIESIKDTHEFFERYAQ